MTKYTEEQLQKAISHVHRDPTVPRARIAALYEVNRTTLNRRIAGTQLTHTAAHRDQQLFTPGEERAIAEHCGTMADLGFPVSHDMLQQIAQDMLNSRNQPPKGSSIGKGNGMSKGHSSSEPLAKDLGVHIVGVHWVDRFLRRNPEFKKRYVRYQERARKAASNDEESQAHFLHLLANPVRRHKVAAEDIWNCDEKGITMGRNQIRSVAIVRRSTKQATMMSEGSREFCSVLDTINASGSVIPLFIVWKGKTHRDSYYKKGDDRDATFAVSPSGYMDDELGLLYISKHFEPHTRMASRPRILIVDGHSSHICWPVVQYALDHNIHMIQLPSKSTHILQPLDVGCFALLQASYEWHLRDWLLKNPLSAIRKIDFLELLFNARTEVYSVDTIKKAWKASGCWPIDMDRARGVPQTQTSKVSPKTAKADAPKTAKEDDRALDTPLLIRKLARETEEQMIAAIDNGTKRSLFRSFVDATTAKLTTYRDIAPRATTLNKLRSGKTRTRGSSKQVGGKARVLSRAVLNEGIRKAELAAATKAAREQAALENRLAAEEAKRAKQALEDQWRLDLKNYVDHVEPAWRAECAVIEAAWGEQRDAARMVHKRAPKKPTLPPKPKRLLKPKVGTGDLTTLDEGALTTLDEADETQLHACEESDDDDEITENMRNLELDRFAELV